LDKTKDFWRTHASERTAIPLNGVDIQVFFDVFPPMPRLIIIGAVHIAMPLVEIAKTLGFHTIVIDARGAFATPERFPNADQLIKQWPHEALNDLKLDESSYVVTLTHDEKFDNPALKIALNSPARYIGALGSKKTHAKRCEALLQDGVTQAQLERIHAPIGLKIGSRGPREIALSIIAEMIAVSHGL
jgi:xanthine dehydrogenase accessory factor